MTKKKKPTEPSEKTAGSLKKLAFALENEPLSSSPALREFAVIDKSAASRPVYDEEAAAAAIPPSASSVSPVFAALEKPVLPELPRNDRARLQVQSPNRLFFYWSIGGNPFQKLRRAVGPSTGAYSLVVRLLDRSNDSQQIHQVESDGSFWFDVEAGNQYRAEIGFYAPNRPFVRILFSNTVETPRKSPSPHPAADADWRVPAQNFSNVLSAAGFARDAFEVALAGDDARMANQASRNVWSDLAGTAPPEIGFDYSELRYALFAIASGLSFDELRAKIGPMMFALVAENAPRLLPSAVAAALEKYFAGADFEAEMLPSSGVFGASLLNFPSRLARWPGSISGLEPGAVGSHTVNPKRFQ